MTAPLPHSQPEGASELLPCPLCASTNVSPGTCYVDLAPYSPYTPGKQPAVRCVNCGCRATLKAWNARPATPADGAREALAKVKTVVRLAIGDGEYIGRHERSMEPAAVISLREGATAERLAAVRHVFTKLTPASLAQCGVQCASDGLTKAMEIVGNMRQSDAGRFDDPKYCGQRGCDRADALYDAYVAIRAALPSTVPSAKLGGGK